MAGAAGGELAAAISAAGGLGMIGAAGSATPAWIAEQARVAAAGGRPWGVGLLAWALADNPAQLDAVAELAPPLVSVSFGPYRGTWSGSSRPAARSPPRSARSPRPVTPSRPAST
jgi:nitronate monooxygenase